MIDSNKSQTESYTFIKHQFTTASFLYPEQTKQMKQHRRRLPAMVKDSRLQETWILVSTYIFIHSNFAISVHV